MVLVVAQGVVVEWEEVEEEGVEGNGIRSW